jgi:hypothetical protein
MLAEALTWVDLLGWQYGRLIIIVGGLLVLLLRRRRRR